MEDLLTVTLPLTKDNIKEVDLELERDLKTEYKSVLDRIHLVENETKDKYVMVEL